MNYMWHAPGKCTLLFGCLMAAASWGVWGLGTAGDFAALKQALGLSDVQLAKLRQPKAPPVRPATGGIAFSYTGGARIATLERNGDPVQIAILDDAQRARLAEIDQVTARQDAAELATRFGLIPAGLWPGEMCGYPIGVYSFAAELGLSEAQRQALTRLQWEAQEAGARPRREQALAVLDEGQRAKIAAFEAAVRLAREAVALGLIAPWGRGEAMCH